MRWSRPEQLVTLGALAAALVAAGALAAVRRPAPPVRLIEPAPADAVVVQVDGEVVRPGLYRLAAGSRVADAVQAAGGMLPGADTQALNLARLLRDGDRVTVPPRASLGPTGPGAPVNINTADAARLETLPGIGPILARRIVEYRNRHGPFQRLEDLLQVQGIGPRLLERLRPLVTVP
ncbi:MAG: ComEA family DNA-binding protein [Armatimonadota bacterium]|nr:ComEA family DNA-binding protein [Armatimonadota bacterium]MDR7507431.1 ComEA family DNA-binding protein [Armatimonadota bacterium]MDR7508759.1 ComEA family DNA-binding protein [Armatimonadota bacterium]MDR7583203.1 ComEA family DNA-binding protein [Armatimonadota bacterium]